MGLFFKSNDDIIKKYLKEKNISYKFNEGRYELTLTLKDNVIIYPYFKITEDNFSFIINLKKTDDNNKLLDKINTFNVISKYLVCKLNEGILYLEYNSIIDNNIKDILDNIFLNISALANEIDEL